MEHAKPTVLLTRPKVQSRAFLTFCETELGKPIPALISPVLTIVPVDATPELDDFKTLIFTSANGVNQIGPAMAGRDVVTVGKRTAELAADFGANARMLGENVAGLVSNAGTIQPPALICRGRHASADLQAALQGRGTACDEVVLYDQVETPLSDAALALLTGDAPVILPVFSPRSARLLSKQGITAPVHVVAISPETAKAWTGPGQVQIAGSPDARSICLAVGDLI